jgi:hypothetical protein
VQVDRRQVTGLSAAKFGSLIMGPEGLPAARMAPSCTHTAPLANVLTHVLRRAQGLQVRPAAICMRLSATAKRLVYCRASQLRLLQYQACSVFTLGNDGSRWGGAD